MNSAQAWQQDLALEGYLRASMVRGREMEDLNRDNRQVEAVVANMLLID